MSEPMLISPMLDNFVMGDPISNHHGVRCCPAMEKDSDGKYIVKIISVPASQVQLDALLLTGACKDEASALSYFKELADNVAEEAQILQRLSQMDGFLSYHSWQIVPMENEVGYDIYLLGSYKKTLEQYFRKNAMTHLGAINLGLDLCAALAVCRRMGYLYADLKPGNVYITEDNEYRIGDLGFLKLDNLKYASLPDKYRSAYTPPEIADAYASLNTTVDIYALGLILYQAYNDGVRPTADALQNGAPLPAPAYADYEMAEIILKACAADPQDRWQDPAEMGQALVSYMQRNGANDTPITPAPAVSEDIPNEIQVTTESEIDNATAEEAVSDSAEASQDALVDEIISSDDTDASSPLEIEEAGNTATEDISSDGAENPLYTEDELGNLSFMTEIPDDETTPGHEAPEFEYEEVTDEVSQILTIADDLISHETPDPVIPPEPIDVPIPPPIILEETNEDEPISEEPQESQDQDPVQSEEDEEAIADDESVTDADEDLEIPNEKPAKNTSKGWILGGIVALLVVALLFVGFYYYQHFYLQPVSISLEGSENSLIVYVDSQIDDSKLTVICSDAYGNQLQAPVIDGKAIFENLAPNSAYNVKVVIQGFHHLTGNSSTGYSTPVQTNILQFNAVTGASDGSVVLTVTHDGPDTNQWTVTYFAEGEEEKIVPFTGHTLTLSQLAIGKEYTFILMPKDEMYIAGTNTITFTPSKVITAQDLIATSFAGGSLTVSWKSPPDTSVENWIVNCYNDNGYSESVTVQDPNTTFLNIDHNSSYTVEVKAVGMSTVQRIDVVAGSISISNLIMDDSQAGRLKLSWESSAPAPTDGWIIQYTIDGTVTKQITATENTAVITDVVPGAEHKIVIQAADGTPVYSEAISYTADEANDFSGYDITAENITFYMCRTPDVEDWDRYDLSSSDYVTTFTLGEKASFLARMRQEYDTSEDLITTLFVIRDTEGRIVNADSAEATWTSMWYRNYGEFDIPSIPATPGTYNVSIYFNGSFVFSVDFTVVSE